MAAFKIPEIPPTTCKTIRFPVPLVNGIEAAIRTKDCTFTAFVVAAARVALMEVEDSTDYILQRTKFKHSLDRLTAPYCEDISVDQVLTALLSLDPSARKSVAEFIGYLASKREHNS